MSVRCITASGAEQLLAAAGFDGLTRTRAQGMIGQQLQDPCEPPRAGHCAMVLFQLGSELGEAGWQLPVPVHRSMVQRAGLAAQCRKVVEWIEDQGVESCGDRAWVATTWPPATITTRST